MISAAREAWSAWVHPTPERLAAIAARATSPMTYLPAAARRMLEQLPDVRTGLNRTERQGLEAVAGRAPSLHAAFAASQDMEERPWQGDSMFFAPMWDLTQGQGAAARRGGRMADPHGQPEEPEARPDRAGARGARW